MVVAGVLLLLCALWLWRVQQVIKFKTDVLTMALQACQDDWRHGHSGYWRIEVWGSVPEVRMILRFWRPLRVDEWWLDTHFVARVPRETPSYLKSVK